ncbi:M23 family metallopeptidase [Caldithrix abyssi]
MKNFGKILLVLLIWHGAKAQNYLWPTSASDYLTSSFCEYRPGHYHSAIDIKTWNQEGYAVYAVEDGTVYRIRVSPHGYGKVIYLKLKDGRFAVYAHLQRFNRKLEEKVRQIQLKNRRYTIDWRPKNWPVKKGEIIAYTGQTGTGVPHLHFEIRDAQHRALNPLHFYRMRVKDQIAPRLQELLIIPLNKNSAVNGSVLPKSIPLKKENGIYVLNETVYARGKIGLAIRGYDRANDVYNKYGFYREQLYINDSLIFEAKYDTLDFSKTSQINIGIYYPLKALQNKRFLKLFKEPYNQLDFYRTAPDGGVIYVKEQPVHFKIIIKDFWDNQSVVRGRILPAFNPPPQILYARRLKDQLFVKALLPRNLRTLDLLHPGAGGAWQKVRYYEIVQQEFRPQNQQILIKAPLNPVQTKKIKIVGVASDGRRFALLNDFAHSADTIAFKLINYGKYWVAQLSPPQNTSLLDIETRLNGRVIHPVSNLNDRFLELVIPPGEGDKQTLQLRVAKFQKTVLDTTIHFAVLFPGISQHIALFNDSLQIETTGQTVYDTLLFSARKNDSVLTLKDSLPILSAEYDFSWYPQPFRKGVRIVVKTDSTPLPARTLGLYRFVSEKGLRYVGGQSDTAKQTVVMRSKGLGSIVAAADTVPPVVEILFPAPNARLKALKFVKISAFDSLSGLDSDLNFRIFIDDQWMIPEWDPERKLVLATPHWKLKAGQHRLLVEVQDRAGNVSKQSLVFFIKGN